MTSNINKHILRYIDMVETGEIIACEDQHLLVSYVRSCFQNEKIYTDDEQLEKYLGLGKYFPYEKIFEWQEFCVGLHLCTFWKDTGLPRWPDLFLLIGRGAGKDGFIAFEAMCLISPHSNLKSYDVDICANAEEQAMRPVNDLHEIMESVEHTSKLKNFFSWTKEKITGIKHKGTVKGRTNNPKSKDGMRSGMIVFNEIHQYINYVLIKVFMTGLGKKKHPRSLYATTNGDIRDGPLDDMVAKGEGILKGEIGDNGLLPFMCRLDKKEEADYKHMWQKANPSLPDLPVLMGQIQKEYIDWKESPSTNADFMTKRMNLPQSDSEVAVTDWENIKATNRELPDLTGWSCTCGIDFVKVTDWASVNLHFKKGDDRYDINHSWFCIKSADLERIKVPWQEWAEQGCLTIVDDVEIHPDLLAQWIFEQATRYNIVGLALDNFRYALLSKSLKKVGFDASEKKNVKLVRPSDIMKVAPIIDRYFANRYFIWGDHPPLRWATNNTKVIRASRSIGSDTGNFYYGKIEPKSRKTDPFMALVASVVIEDDIPELSQMENIPIITL